MNRRLRAFTITALSIAGLLLGAGNSALSPVSSAHADGPNVTGTYLADQGSGNFYGMYYVRQLSGTVWWAGFSMDPNLALDQQFHRGVDFTNVFRGAVSYDPTLGSWVVSGDWVDMSRGVPLTSGTVILKIDLASDGSVAGLETQAQTGGLNATHWTPTTFSEFPDMYERFTEVEKSVDVGLIFEKPGSLSAEGLKPYRDETVFYGRVTDTSIDDGQKTEVPGFNDQNVPANYTDFICDTSQDHDLDMNIAINQNKLEPSFAQTGWGPRDPQDVLQKLSDTTAQGPAGLLSNESYIHAEVMMYGHTATCGDAKSGDTGRVLYPGWGDTGGNSVLVNGRPVDGHLTQLYGSDPNTGAAYKEGVEFNDQTLLPGDQIRITGALILDCGHSDFTNPTGDCHLGNAYKDDDKAQNQEIHPVYSIDVISHNAAHTNLTGAWGGDDGSTYYIRQMGNTIWMLGLFRDREPLVPVGSPPMLNYATVFTGTITHQPDGSDTISGGGVDVPYPGGLGGTHPYTANFDVDSSRTLITTSSTTGYADFGQGFQLHKLYEPEDSSVPQSQLHIGAPQYYPAASSQPFVTSNTPLTVTGTVGGTGIAYTGLQNVWYRVFPQGSTPPAYTPVLGSSASFTLSGPDGLYEVDSYATDNAGNDEAPHTQLVYLDNTPPQTTINQPAATTYTHSQTLTLDYTVDDGTGSGVQSATPTLDNAATVGGPGLQSGQAISLLTLPLGTHTFTVDAQDHVGNASTHSVAFTLIVTAQSILGDVNQFVASGAITQNGGTSLLAKLNSAAKARTAGDCMTAASVYQGFINEVQARSGKKITASAASTMIADAQYLITHCP